ncbi:MAG: KdsC family phosphatase [Planctomycetota bacterium]|jgi:3-deoxy-D-manno-octulosonate 8-phosphate phosphatase (KDO 8-P phosphatase)
MKKPNLTDIKMLVLDVDGVLTDGRLTINSDGTESISFAPLDGHAIRMWKRAGLKVAFLTGRRSEPAKIRAEQLGVDYVLQNCHYKAEALDKLLDQSGLTPQNIAYIGDDLPDLPPITTVGFGVAVANAVDEVKKYADYVTTHQGGKGAVREVIEYILKNTGKWQELMKRYLP